MENSCQTPAEIRQRVWTELTRATRDRHHAWRTPVLATTGDDGLPDARTVVLRETDADAAQLRFFTDGRSAKVSQLADRPDAVLVFWSKRLNWQLRVRVSVTLHTEGPRVETVWARVSQSAAAGDYLSPSAPGTTRPETSLSAQPHESGSQARHHLVIASAAVHEIDWLELARGGHRRARLRADDWEWLTP
jgi:pyridoxamine 5'-phosphate oxidase